MGKGGRGAASNRANQMNPNNPAYYSSRGTEAGSLTGQKAAVDNRANQLNPEHPAYRKSRRSDGANPERGGELSNVENDAASAKRHRPTPLSEVVATIGETSDDDD